MMLKPLKFVAYRPLAILNFAFLTFLRRSVNKSTFDFHLFPKKFRCYIRAKNRLKIYNGFKNLHKLLWQDCNALERAAIVQCAACFRKTAAFCEDTEIIPHSFDALPESVKKELKSFAISLYDKVLKSEGFTSSFGGTLDGHYQALLEKNGNPRFCPFCYHSHYPAHRSELDYDHFLNKGNYPLAAVNLRNLVPMCQPCNKTYKGQKDVLRANNSTDRRKILYPYSTTCSQIELHIELHEQEAEKWIVNIRPVESRWNEHVSSWDDVFSIHMRYTGEVRKQNGSWWEAFWTNLRTNSSSIDDVRRSILEYRTNDAVGRLIPLNGLRLAYFKYLEQAPDKKLRGLMRINPDAL